MMLLSCYLYLYTYLFIKIGDITSQFDSLDKQPALEIPEERYCEYNAGGSRHKYFRGYCFYFENQVPFERDWYTAENYYLENYGQHLASIHDMEENEFILNEIRDKSSGYWIGLNELDLKSYRWSDKSSFDFELWAKGQPDDQHGAQLCVYMNASTGRWHDEDCTRRLQSVHKRPAQKLNTLHTTVNPSVSDGNCPPDFYETDKKCFKFFKKLKTWSEAQDSCKELTPGTKHGLLASIISYYDEELLNVVMHIQNESFWVGLRRRQDIGRWKWSQNEEGIINWLKTPIKSEGNCAVISKTDGENAETGLLQKDCSDKYPYICQIYKDRNHVYPTLSPDRNVLCPPNYSDYADDCYRFIKANSTWSESEKHCVAEGGHLASIHSSAVNLYLRYLRILNLGYPGEAWIGLSDIPIRNYYHWSDHWPVTFTSWSGNGVPNSPAGGGCTALAADRNIDRQKAKWEDRVCWEERSFLCKLTRKQPDRTVPPLAGFCNNERWHPHGELCLYFGDKRVKSWREASEQCDKLNATLLSVRDPAETNFIRLTLNSAVPSYTFSSYMIGLRRTQKDGWRWSDGTPISYYNWNSRFTNENTSHCATLNMQAVWYQQKCSLQSTQYVSFACKKYKVLYAKQIEDSVKPDTKMSTAFITATSVILVISSIFVVAILIILSRRKHPFRIF